MQTKYTLAEKLKAMTFRATDNPVKLAKEGYTVFVLVSTHIDIGYCQRSIYQKLVQDKIPIKETRSGQIIFANGGKLLIFPGNTEQEKFMGYSKERSYYCVYN